MDSYAISRVRTRYIVPFEINIEENNFEEICRKIDNYVDEPYAFLGQKGTTKENRWIRESLRKGEQDVYGYILDEFSLLGDIDYAQKIEKAGCFWKYNSFVDNPYDMKFSFAKELEKEMDFYDISIVDMGLYAFRSGVGFLWYEIGIDADKIRDSAKLIKFQNIIKELNRGYNNHLWIDSENIKLPNDMNEIIWIPFMLGNWIAERLAFLNVKFQAERKNSYAGLLGNCFFSNLERIEKKKQLSRLYNSLPENCPDKALLFTYAVFERNSDWKVDDNAIRTTYYLTNGYKESYEMSDNVTNIVRKPFSNVLWMATREGCGYYAWQGENNGTFFTKNQYAKIMNDYFLLYIRVIYQSFSLMKYAVYTSEVLPNDFNTYLQISEETENLSDKISKICTEISLFLVKSIATSVSHIQHQNDFYGYLYEQLEIKEDVSCVTAGLEVLNELQKEKVLKKQKQIAEMAREEQAQIEQREKEADNTFQIGLGIMTFLAGISAITDSYGIVCGLANDSLPVKWLIVFLFLFCICSSIVISSLFIFIKSVKKLKRTERERKNG